MKKTIKITYLLLAVIAIQFTSCSSDDDRTPTDPDATIDEIIAAITNDGTTRTWKIDSAALTNSSVSGLNVIDAFNINDDEFIFSVSNQNLVLEHKQRHAFNEDATNFQTFLQDNYQASINYDFTTNSQITSLFTSTNNDLELFYLDDNTILGEWNLNSSDRLGFKIRVKTADDYQSATTSLNFSELATIPQEFGFLEHFNSADVVVSNANNSLYIVYSTDFFVNPDGDTPRAEGVIRYDFNSNTFNNNIYHNADFFTKRAHVDLGGLYTSGSQFYNTYTDLDIPSNPDTVFYNELLDYFFVRHDIVSYNNETYLLGGNPIHQGEPNPFNAVLKYNPSTAETLTQIASLPNPKAHAASELVDGKVYTFGGTYSFGTVETAETLCYIYDIDSNTFDSFNIPQALAFSFTTSIENIIYVAGQILVLDPETNSIVDRNAYLGAYDTETNEFTEIAHNLDDSDTFSRISGIAAANGKLYVVYQNSNDPDNENYVIMTADL